MARNKTYSRAIKKHRLARMRANKPYYKSSARALRKIVNAENRIMRDKKIINENKAKLRKNRKKIHSYFRK